MIPRRNCLVGTGAVLVCAPGVVRAASLTPIDGLAPWLAALAERRRCIFGFDDHRYGFCDRLWIASRYRSGDLRGRELLHVIGHGVLIHIPAERLAFDIERWGLDELSPAARRERAAFYDHGRPLRCPRNWIVGGANAPTQRS